MAEKKREEEISFIHSVKENNIAEISGNTKLFTSDIAVQQVFCKSILPHDGIFQGSARSFQGRFLRHR